MTMEIAMPTQQRTYQLDLLCAFPMETQQTRRTSLLDMASSMSHRPRRFVK